MEEGANSTLSIAKVGPTDSGNYTCQLTTMPDQPATVHVHVLNGEDTIIYFNIFSTLSCWIAVEISSIRQIIYLR